MDKKKTSPFSRSVAQVMLVSATLGRPMIATPGTPADRVNALRDAYLKAFNDPEVVQEAKKSRLDLQALSGAEVEAQIREVLNQPSDVIQRVKKLAAE